MKYIDSEKLIAEIKRQIESAAQKTDIFYSVDDVENEKKYDDERNVLERLLKLVTSLQQEQPNNMIQWTGNNLKEVIDFTGKSPKFGEWFKSWDELESYVHSHGDILKLFSDDGSHFEVPVGAWIVKTPDGYNVPSVARFIHAKQEQPEVDLEKEILDWIGDEDSCKNGEWTWYECNKMLRHFYELGLNAKKE